ncbi:MAG: LuxR C-terminal-related transcriptional regulator [Acidimicrobiales bacterium]
MDERISVGTRCCVPRLPDAVVHRPRLARLLADGIRCPVTLVSGPPGAGKTTLLASWVHSVDDRAMAWLTVDGRDDEQGRLADLVVETMTRAGVLGDPMDSPASAEALLDAAFERLMDRDAECVLVLEDVQEIRSPEALRMLAYLVDRAPPGLDVVLSTRADPPIGWGRVWLDGRLGQIRHADLAFNEAETTALVAAHGVALSPDDIRTLMDRTEGWAAGLRLAVGALQSDDDPHRFVLEAAATEAAVSDYMLGEVLMRQEDSIQDFLLRTSVVDRLTPGLAVELTGDPDAVELLLDLVQRGLFVVEVDDRTCFRYHSLFRALLQAHLHHRDPGLVVAMHERAAAWHLAHGLSGEAEQHARAAGDWGLVGRLILQRWLTGAVGGGGPSPHEPLAGVPPEAVLRTASLAMVAATEACRWSRHEDADLYRSALDTIGPGPVHATMGHEPDGDTARLLFDVSYGWSFGIDDRSRAAVATLRDRTAPELWTPRLRQLAILAQAEQDIEAGELDRARHHLEQLAEQGERGWHQTLTEAVLALVDAAAGAVVTAEARVSRAFTELDQRTAQPTTNFAYLAKALCAAQRGGQRTVADALSAVDPSMEWSSRSLRYVDRVLRASASGRAPFFVSLDQDTAHHPLAERALIALGVLEVVDAHGRPVVVGGHGEQVVLQARQQLADNALGTLNGAEGTVMNWLDHATNRHPRTVVEARLLAAVATHHRGERATARRHLGEALDLSAATGITAPLLAYGTHLEVLLAANLDDLGRHATSALDLLDRFHHTATDGLVEPLTEREVEVLQHLPTLMSNTEIAQGMHLSVNTVKTHLKSVYRKLGVDGRREAVLRGRDLELI